MNKEVGVTNQYGDDEWGEGFPADLKYAVIASKRARDASGEGAPDYTAAAAATQEQYAADVAAGRALVRRERIKKWFHPLRILLILLLLAVIGQEFVAIRSFRSVRFGNALDRGTVLVAEVKLNDGSYPSIDLTTLRLQNVSMCRMAAQLSSLNVPQQVVSCEMEGYQPGARVPIGELSLAHENDSWKTDRLYWYSEFDAYTYKKGWWSPLFPVVKAIRRFFYL